MKEYIISIVAVSILAALACFVSYGGVSERAVKGAVSVILIYTVCVPAVELVGDLSREDFELDFRIEEQIESTVYSDTAEVAFVNGVKRYICDEFNLNEKDVEIRIHGFDFQKIQAERISVSLSGRAALADSARIERCVEESGLGNCEVNIKIG